MGGVAGVAGTLVVEEMGVLLGLGEDGDGDGDVVMVGCKAAMKYD